MQVSPDDKVSKEEFDALQTKVHELETRADGWSAEKEAWATEKASWTAEKATLQAKLEALEAALVQSHKQAQAYKAAAAQASSSATPVDTKASPYDMPANVFRVQSELLVSLSLVACFQSPRTRSHLSSLSQLHHHHSSSSISSGISSGSHHPFDRYTHDSDDPSFRALSHSSTLLNHDGLPLQAEDLSAAFTDPVLWSGGGLTTPPPPTQSPVRAFRHDSAATVVGPGPGSPMAVDTAELFDHEPVPFVMSSPLVHEEERKVVGGPEPVTRTGQGGEDVDVDVDVDMADEEEADVFKTPHRVLKSYPPENSPVHTPPGPSSSLGQWHHDQRLATLPVRTPDSAETPTRPRPRLTLKVPPHRIVPPPPPTDSHRIMPPPPVPHRKFPLPNDPAPDARWGSDTSVSPTIPTSSSDPPEPLPLNLHPDGDSDVELEEDVELEADTESDCPPSDASNSSDDLEQDPFLLRRPFVPVERVRRPEAPALERVPRMGKRERGTVFDLDEEGGVGEEEVMDTQLLDGEEEGEEEEEEDDDIDEG